MRMILRDACQFYSGTGFPEIYQGAKEGQYPFYKVGDISANVTNGNIYLHQCGNYVSEEIAATIRGTIIPPGTVVFAKIGEALKKNRRALTACNCLVDNNVMGIAPRSEILRTKYFYYYMCNIKMQKYAESTAVPSVRKSRLEHLWIDVPNLKDQEAIEKILDATTVIIRERQRQLLILDNLIKARFVEMFGNPEYNEKGWPIKKLNDLCNVGSSKRIYQEEQTMEGVPFWRISDLVSKMDKGSVESSLFIPESRYEELKEQGLVPEPGDILVTSRGTLGRCYIVAPYDRFYFQDGMISWLSQYEDTITPLYIQFLFDMPGFRKQIDGMQAGSTVAYLSIAMLKKLDIMLPSRDVQEQFNTFVSQVDKSKVVVQKALDEAKLLFESLMQKFFG